MSVVEPAKPIVVEEVGLDEVCADLDADSAAQGWLGDMWCPELRQALCGESASARNAASLTRNIIYEAEFIYNTVNTTIALGVDMPDADSVLVVDYLPASFLKNVEIDAPGAVVGRHGSIVTLRYASGGGHEAVYRIEGELLRATLEQEVAALPAPKLFALSGPLCGALPPAPPEKVAEASPLEVKVASVPIAVYATDPFNMTITVSNTGLMPAGGVQLRVYADGREVASQVLDGVILPLGTAELVVPVTLAPCSFSLRAGDVEAYAGGKEVAVRVEASSGGVAAEAKDRVFARLHKFRGYVEVKDYTANTVMPTCFVIYNDGDEPIAVPGVELAVYGKDSSLMLADYFEVHSPSELAAMGITTSTSGGLDVLSVPAGGVMAIAKAYSLPYALESEDYSLETRLFDKGRLVAESSTVISSVTAKVSAAGMLEFNYRTVMFFLLGGIILGILVNIADVILLRAKRMKLGGGRKWKF